MKTDTAHATDTTLMGALAMKYFFVLIGDLPLPFKTSVRF